MKRRKLTELNAEIRNMYNGGVRPKNIAQALQMTAKNVNNRISVMRKSGHIKRKNAGKALGLPMTAEAEVEVGTGGDMILGNDDTSEIGGAVTIAGSPIQSFRTRLLAERSAIMVKVDAIDRLLAVL